jgi:hypothetical protein
MEHTLLLLILLMMFLLLAALTALSLVGVCLSLLFLVWLMREFIDVGHPARTVHELPKELTSGLFLAQEYRVWRGESDTMRNMEKQTQRQSTLDYGSMDVEDFKKVLDAAGVSSNDTFVEYGAGCGVLGIVASFHAGCSVLCVEVIPEYETNHERLKVFLKETYSTEVTENLLFEVRDLEDSNVRRDVLVRGTVLFVNINFRNNLPSS